MVVCYFNTELNGGLKSIDEKENQAQGSLSLKQ